MIAYLVLTGSPNIYYSKESSPLTIDKSSITSISEEKKSI